MEKCQKAMLGGSHVVKAMNVVARRHTVRGRLGTASIPRTAPHDKRNCGEKAGVSNTYISAAFQRSKLSL